MIRGFPALAASLPLFAAVAAEGTPKIDAKSLEPILSKSWAQGASCIAPEGVMDWAIDRDGWVYRRDGGYTPLDVVRFAGDRLTTQDEVGIGPTISVYELGADGTLRLMSEVWFEDGETGGTPTVQVKDGRRIMIDGGMAAEPEETPAMLPCPKRTSVFPAEPVATLNGKWAAMEGGSCSTGTGAILFDLERPVPRISRGPMGDLPESEAYVLAIAHDGDGWAVTEGSAMEASIYRYTLGKDGTLTQSDDMGGPATRFQRCM
jgi:hypothetical protein